jgi:hypothetical protein
MYHLFAQIAAIVPAGQAGRNRYLVFGSAML